MVHAPLSAFCAGDVLDNEYPISAQDFCIAPIKGYLPTKPIRESIWIISINSVHKILENKQVYLNLWVPVSTKSAHIDIFSSLALKLHSLRGQGPPSGVELEMYGLNSWFTDFPMIQGKSVIQGKSLCLSILQFLVLYHGGHSPSCLPPFAVLAI